MGFIEKVASLLDPDFVREKEKEAEAERQERRQEIIDSFNIVRIDGENYITYQGVVISRKGDTDLIDRIDEFRVGALASEGF